MIRHHEFSAIFFLFFCRIPRRCVSVVTALSSIPKKFHAVNPQFSPRLRIFVAVEVVSSVFSHITQTVEDEARLSGTGTQR